MSKPKLVVDLPLLRPDVFFTEAAAQLKEHPYPLDKVPQDLVVLVVDRKDVEFLPGPSDPFKGDWGLGLGNVKVRVSPDAYVVALASTITEDGECALEHNAHRTWQNFPDGLRTKIFILFKCLIGSMGIYPFKRIWALTVPSSWRDESGIEKELPIGSEE